MIKNGEVKTNFSCRDFKRSIKICLVTGLVAYFLPEVGVQDKFTEEARIWGKCGGKKAVHTTRFATLW